MHTKQVIDPYQARAWIKYQGPAAGPLALTSGQQLVTRRTLRYFPNTGAECNIAKQATAILT